MTQMIPARVNGDLRPVEKLEVHQKGLRHPAISEFVLDQAQTLLQRRALEKYHTPGLWANACCTHPHWGEAFHVCAARRLEEELGVQGMTLVARDTVEYRADVGNGLIEHEVVNLFLAEGRPTLALNPSEVMETRWIDMSALRDEISEAPERFTPWLRIYLEKHSSQIFREIA